MRKLLILAFMLAACSKTETPAADSTAMAPAMAPAPAPLMAADLTGTWNGVTMPEVGDSVLAKWTAVNIDSVSGKVTPEGAKEAIPFTTVIAGDSSVATSGAYVDPANAKGPKITFRSVARLKDGKLVGTMQTMLASKPDSVLARVRWEATRAAPK